MDEATNKSRMDYYIENFLPIAGGDGTGEDPPPSGDPESNGDPSENNPPDSGWKTGDPLDQHPRFKEVYGERNAARESLKKWDELGSLDDIQDRLDRLNQYEEKIKEVRDRQAMSQEEQDQQAYKARIRKQMLDVYPELSKLEKFDESTYDDRYVSREEQNWERASNHFGNLLKANQINVDRETQDDIEDFVLAKMTDQEKQQVASGDFSSIKGVYERVSKSPLFKGFSPAPSNENRGAVNEPVPKRMKPGGTTPKPGDKKAKTWADAEDRAWAKMKAEFPGG